MKLTDFIEFYKQKSTEEVKDISVRNYIPIDEKIEIMHKIDMDILVDSVNAGDAYSVVKMKTMQKFFKILLSYIDIEVDDFSDKVYDECIAIGIDRLITNTTNHDDYDRFCEMYDEVTMISDATLLREILRETNGKDIKGELEYMLGALSKNQKVLSNLNEIMGINNAGFKK